MMSFLKRIAAEANIAILCTIHQPPASVFAGFDNTLILSEAQVLLLPTRPQGLPPPNPCLIPTACTYPTAHFWPTSCPCPRPITLIRRPTSALLPTSAPTSPRSVTQWRRTKIRLSMCWT